MIIVMSFFLFPLLALASLVLVAVVRLRNRDGWLVVALRAVWLALGLVSVVVVVTCIAAATDDGRIGSETVGVGFGKEALTVETHVNTEVGGVGDGYVVDGTGTGDTPGADGSRSPARVRHALDSLAALAGPAAGGDPRTPSRVKDAVVVASIPDPTVPQTLIVLFAAAVSLIPLVGGLIAIERLLRRAAAADAFSTVSVSELRWLAVVIGAGSYVASLVDFGAAEAVAGGRFDGLQARLELGLGPLAIGLLLLALAEVWRHGLDLREDVEATI